MQMNSVVANFATTAAADKRNAMTCPKGAKEISPGLRGMSYPGITDKNRVNPNGGGGESRGGGAVEAGD